MPPPPSLARFLVPAPAFSSPKGSPRRTADKLAPHPHRRAPETARAAAGAAVSNVRRVVVSKTASGEPGTPPPVVVVPLREPPPPPPPRTRCRSGPGARAGPPRRSPSTVVPPGRARQNTTRVAAREGPQTPGNTRAAGPCPGSAPCARPRWRTRSRRKAQPLRPGSTRTGSSPRTR